MTPIERAFLERRRVARLATADADGNPHVVPICFAVVDTGDGGDPRLVTPIDEKPKSTSDLQRVRDVRENPRVAVVADRYAEDWARLAWVQVRGRARVVEPGGSALATDRAGAGSPGNDDHARAVAALRAKYDQYADHALDRRPVIAVVPDRTLSWGELAPD